MEQAPSVATLETVSQPEERIARLGDRAIAAIMDGVTLLPIFLATGGVVAYLYGIPPVPDGSFNLQGGPALLSMALDALLWSAYYFVSEWTTSTTLGKEAMAIEVRGASGGKCTAVEALIRNALRPVDAFGFYLVALVVTTFSPLNQRIGDRAAGTVVREKVKAKRRWAVVGWIALNLSLCYGALTLVEFVQRLALGR